MNRERSTVLMKTLKLPSNGRINDVWNRFSNKAMSHPQALLNALLWLTSLSGVFLGIALAFSSSHLDDTGTYDIALKVAPPGSWAALFFLGGLMVAVSSMKGYQAAESSTLVLSIILAFWSICLIASSVPTGLYTPIVAYMALSSFAAVTSLACGSQARATGMQQ